MDIRFLFYKRFGWNDKMINGTILVLGFVTNT